MCGPQSFGASFQWRLDDVIIGIKIFQSGDRPLTTACPALADACGIPAALTIGGDMKHDASLANVRVAFTNTDFADAGNVHIANKSPAFDIGDFVDDGKVHIANKSPAFDIADFIDDGRVHIANKSPAFDVISMDEAA
ncbi:hypothetical protein [Rhizobium terrae]|uniref:hypothetical protein n=1 Tax=Rhizobium terrae TaxID=2171756 RepID=UPI0013C2B6B6|nr:hypothetical protein [Rhizobium terrae]